MDEFLYDTIYDPALPVCTVTLVAKSTGQQVDLTAIIDTGTDGTIIPIQYLRRRGAAHV